MITVAFKKTSITREPIGISVAGFNYDPVILDLGQSNASGTAEVNRLLALSSYVVNPAGVKIWSRSSYLDYKDTGTWVNLSLGVNNQPGFSVYLYQHGAEAILGPEVRTILGKTVYYIKFGVTSYMDPTVGFSDWSPSSSNDLFSTVLANFVHTALSALKDQGLTPKIVGMTWQQGESDATDGAKTAAYGANFATFMTAIRASTPYLANVPLFIRKIYYAISANEATINAAFDTYAASDPSRVFTFDVASQTAGPARKQDISAGEKATYPPSGVDDNHNSHYYYEKAGVLIKNSMVSNNAFANANIVSETYPNYEVNRVVDRANLLGYTKPNAAWFSKCNTLITTIKAITAGSATWKKIHGLYLHDSTGDMNFTRLNFKNLMWGDGIYNGAPVFTPGTGVAFTGNPQYFRANVPGTNIASIDSAPYSNLTFFSLVDSLPGRFAMGLHHTGATSDMFMTSDECNFWEGPGPGITIPGSARFLAITRSADAGYDYYIDAVKTAVVGNRQYSYNGDPSFGFDGFYYGAQVQRVSGFGQGMTQAEIDGIRTALTTYKNS